MRSVRLHEAHTVRSSRPTRRGRRPFFPLVEPSLRILPSPCVVVGVGPEGRAAVRQAEAAEHPSAVLVTDEQSPEAWRQELDRRPPLPDGPCFLAESEWFQVLVVGWADHVAGAWSTLAARLKQLRDTRPSFIVTLEWGPAQAAFVGPAARFRLAERYATGVLPADALATLAGRLVQRGAGGELIRFVQRHNPASVVEVGAAMVWLPQTPVEEALGLYLSVELARCMARPSPWMRKSGTSLFRAALPPALAPRLWPVLQREADETVELFQAGGRQADALPLHSGAHPGAAAAMRIVQAWAAQVQASFRRVLGARLAAPWDLPAVRQAIAASAAEVRDTASAATRREAAQAAVRRALASRVLSTDAKLRGPRRRTPLRALTDRWATRRLGRLVRRFATARTDELVTHYQAVALGMVQHWLEALGSQLADLSGGAERREAELKALLRPPQANLLAIQDEQTLEAVLREMAESISRAHGCPVTIDLWRGLSGKLLAGGAPAAQSPWAQADTEARDIANSLPDPRQPLSRPCLSLLPQYRPETLRALLTRLARPSPLPRPPSPSAQTTVWLEEAPGADPGILPVVLWLSWTTT